MKINILQGAFLPVPPIQGGAIESAWFALGKEFFKQGHEVTHISRLGEGLVKSEVIQGVTHLRVRGARAVKNPYLLKLLELPYVLRARKVMPPADILVTHAFWAPLFFPDQEFGRQYVHVGRYPKGQLRLYKKAARFQVPTHFIAKVCCKEVPKFSAKIKVLPYPLTWKTSDKLRFENREKIILYAGRVHPEKGVRELADAWKMVPKEIADGWTLRMIGPWKEEQGGGGKNFRDQLEDLLVAGQNKAEIREPVFNRNELKKEMEKASLFIYPSIAEKGETFGLAVLEAMSCGCVPVVSDLPCFSDFINFGVEGFCLERLPGDNFSETIVETLLETLKISDFKMQQLATASWKRAKQFEIEKVSVRYLEDFASMI